MIYRKLKKDICCVFNNIILCFYDSLQKPSFYVLYVNWVPLIFSVLQTFIISIFDSKAFRYYRRCQGQKLKKIMTRKGIVVKNIDRSGCVTTIDKYNPEYYLRKKHLTELTSVIKLVKNLVQNKSFGFRMLCHNLIIIQNDFRYIETFFSEPICILALRYLKRPRIV